MFNATQSTQQQKRVVEKERERKEKKKIGSSHNEIQITTKLNDRHTQQLHSWEIRLKVRKVDGK